MDSPSFKQQLSPSKTPLFPASPERINQQKLAASFSMPSDLSQKQSDVQAKIAFINGLSRSGSPAPSQQHASAVSSASALQRAILGREEAESAVIKANTLLSEAQSRERRISERLESLLEELQTTRERQAHERTLFEKEVRKARKEAFRAGSILVKVQEELKLSRGEVKTLKDEVRAERDSKEKAKQESFERAYALAGISEELQSVKDQLRAIEANNQHSVLESQVGELEGNESKQTTEYNDQGTCTSPTPRRPKRSADAFDFLQAADMRTENHTHKEETPTKKVRLSRRFSNSENENFKASEDQCDIIEELKSELKSEQRRRERAESMVHFMKMECQFQRCSCRIAESRGHKYVHDKEWDNAIQDMEEVEDEMLHVQSTEEAAVAEHAIREETPPTSAAHSLAESPLSAMTPPTPQYQEQNEIKKASRSPRESSVAFCEVTGTFVQVSSPHAHMHDRPCEEPLVLPSAEDGEDEEIGDPEVSNEVPTETNVSEDELGVPGSEGDIARHSIYNLDPVYHELHTEQSLDGYPPIPAENQNHMVTTIERLPRTSERLPKTPVEQPSLLREESITQTVPIQFESRHSRNPSDIKSGTPLTREEKLAQIRARRGRTQSSTQRSVSAGETSARGGGARAPSARRIPGVMHSDTRSESDAGSRRGTAPVSRRY